MSGVQRRREIARISSGRGPFDDGGSRSKRASSPIGTYARRWTHCPHAAVEPATIIIHLAHGTKPALPRSLGPLRMTTRLAESVKGPKMVDGSQPSPGHRLVGGWCLGDVGCVRRSRRQPIPLRTVLDHCYTGRQFERKPASVVAPSPDDRRSWSVSPSGFCAVMQGVARNPLADRASSASTTGHRSSSLSPSKLGIGADGYCGSRSRRRNHSVVWIIGR